MRDATNAVEVERDVKIPMPDGATLLADIWHPVGVDDAPTILERTPYGRMTLSTWDRSGEVLAARGYRFILQAVRGTDGSGGSQHFFAERDDGRATADWVAAQPWFNGHLGTYGASYMGFTQWALASTNPSYLDAMVISLSSRASSWYLGGALALELMINWDLSALAFLHPERGGFAQDITPEGIERQQQMLTTAFNHLPLGDALLHVAGETHPLYEQQLAHPSADDPHWAPVNFEAALDQWTVPTLVDRRLVRRATPRRVRRLRRAPSRGRARRDAHRWGRAPRRRWRRCGRRRTGLVRPVPARRRFGRGRRTGLRARAG